MDPPEPWMLCAEYTSKFMDVIFIIIFVIINIYKQREVCIFEVQISSKQSVNDVKNSPTEWFLFEMRTIYPRFLKKKRNKQWCHNIKCAKMFSCARHDISCPSGDQRDQPEMILRNPSCEDVKAYNGLVILQNLHFN